MLNLAVMLEDAAIHSPNKVAIVDGETRLTFVEVDAAANQVANLLVSLGVEPGDRVALALPNVAAFPIAYYGILKAGAVAVPFSILLKGREVAFRLKDSDARVYICFEGTPDLPTGNEGATGFIAVDNCLHMLMVTLTSRARSPGDVRERTGRSDRHRSNPLHIRNYRTAQGRRTHPRKLDPQRSHSTSDV
jgi:long-chain acyl-CoA synthetase